MILVVDAGVATMWFVPRNHSANAMLLLAQEFELVAPALIRIEIASALLKASRRKDIPAARDIGAPLITDDATMGETGRRARIETLMIADGPPVARD